MFLLPYNTYIRIYGVYMEKITELMTVFNFNNVILISCPKNESVLSCLYVKVFWLQGWYYIHFEVYFNRVEFS